MVSSPSYPLESSWCADRGVQVTPLGILSMIRGWFGCYLSSCEICFSISSITGTLTIRCRLVFPELSSSWTSDEKIYYFDVLCIGSIFANGGSIINLVFQQRYVKNSHLSGAYTIKLYRLLFAEIGKNMEKFYFVELLFSSPQGEKYWLKWPISS